MGGKASKANSAGDAAAAKRVPPPKQKKVVTPKAWEQQDRRNNNRQRFNDSSGFKNAFAHENEDNKEDEWAQTTYNLLDIRAGKGTTSNNDDSKDNSGKYGQFANNKYASFGDHDGKPTVLKHDHGHLDHRVRAAQSDWGAY